MTWKRRARALAAILASLLVADQLVQWTALGDGVLLGHRIAPFDPPLFTNEQRDTLERLRRNFAAGVKTDGLFDFDGELGWCTKPGSATPDYRFDWAGSRVGVEELAREKRPGLRRVVAVGDSFTLGMEVRGEECWTSLVDRERADLEVANLGVGGYGIDQSLLRLERDGFALQPDEVWLGFMASTALRNVIVYQPGMRRWAPTPTFKPRFELDATGELALVANPASDPERLAELLGSQEAFLAAAGRHDHFVQRAPAAYAPFGTNLLHYCATARLALTVLERGDRAAGPYLADPSSEVWRLSRALFLRAAARCGMRGVRLRVLFFPDGAGLEDAAVRGHPACQSLLDELRGHGIEVIDFTAAVQAALERTGGKLWASGGHYDAAGNRVIADELLRVLAAD